MGNGGAGGEFQQRGRIFRPDIPLCSFHRSLVAGHLHILFHQMKGQPDQRVEPVDRQRPKGQQFHQMIPSPDMNLLVQNQIIPLPFRQPGGQINLRPQQPQHKGTLNVICQTNTISQRDGTGQPPFQAQQRPCSIQRHGGRTSQPKSLRRCFPAYTVPFLLV